ncbi:MAG: 16S rRNA processing protein RimM [Chitinivibrionales bacterium]|nr:16S rRNA processing protein RimM [Chitinivibrionales bacterium]
MSVPAGREPVALGVIGRPRGIRGECRVTAFGRTLECLPLPLTVAVGPGNGPWRELELREVRQSPHGFTCRFGGIEDRDAAESLRNQLISVDRADLPELEQGEYYHFELEGLQVVDEHGAPLGTVVRVHNYPTVDALEVRREKGGTFILPMRDEIVETIEPSAGQVRVRAGALEELL